MARRKTSQPQKKKRTSDSVGNESAKSYRARKKPRQPLGSGYGICGLNFDEYLPRYEKKEGWVGTSQSLNEDTYIGFFKNGYRPSSSPQLQVYCATQPFQCDDPEFFQVRFCGKKYGRPIFIQRKCGPSIQYCMPSTVQQLTEHFIPILAARVGCKPVQGGCGIYSAEYRMSWEDIKQERIGSTQSKEFPPFTRPCLIIKHFANADCASDHSSDHHSLVLLCQEVIKLEKLLKTPKPDQKGPPPHKIYHPTSLPIISNAKLSSSSSSYPPFSGFVGQTPPSSPISLPSPCPSPSPPSAPHYFAAQKQNSFIGYHHLPSNFNNQLTPPSEEEENYQPPIPLAPSPPPPSPKVSRSEPLQSNKAKDIPVLPQENGSYNPYADFIYDPMDFQHDANFRWLSENDGTPTTTTSDFIDGEQDTLELHISPVEDIPVEEINETSKTIRLEDIVHVEDVSNDANLDESALDVLQKCNPTSKLGWVMRNQFAFEHLLNFGNAVYDTFHKNIRETDTDSLE